MNNREIFSKLNFSISTNDFLDVINEFKKDLHEQSSIVFIWIDQFQEYVTEIITPYGLCYTYHIAFSHDILDLNTTSKDFHYQYTLIEAESKNWKSRTPKNFPIQISTSSHGLWAGFSYHEHELSTYSSKSTANPIRGHTVMVNNPFELPTWNSPSFKYNLKFQMRILIDIQMNLIDESLYDYRPDE